MNSFCSALLAVCVMISLAACNTGRKAARKREVVPPTPATAIVTDTVARDTAVAAADTTPPAENTAAADAAKAALIEGLLPLWNRHIPYNTFSGKAKMHYEGRGEKQDFTANIRMERDRRIWVSVVALGMFEVARAMITPDSIILINRINKEVHLLPFSEAGKLIPVAFDFATLQNLIIGDVLQSRERPTDAADFGGGLKLQVTGADYRQEITYNKADSTIRQQQLKSAAADGPSLLIQYGDYGQEAGRLFARQRVLNIHDKGEEHYIDMAFDKVTFDEPVDFSFSIPDKYTRK